MRVGCDCSYTEGCCGVRQLTCFSNEDDRQYTYRDFKAEGQTEAEAWKNLLDRISSYDFSDTGYTYSCSVLQIWFVKKADFNGNYEEEYEAEEFRKLVEQIPGVLHLGEFRNVNSGNMIKGYQWAV